MEINRSIPLRQSWLFRQGKVKTTIWLDPEVYNWTKKQCAIREITMAEVIEKSLRVVREALAAKESKNGI